MPILWRYLLKEYFKVFFLCIGAFLSVLIVMRSQEIARFASLDSNFSRTILFTLYQLPYILPFAIPISGLIAAVLLTQHLSQSCELSSLRACGTSLSKVLTPLIFVSCFLCLLNFVIVSEITPTYRIKSKSLLYESIDNNPLLLFKKKNLIKLENTYIDMTLNENSSEATDLIFAFLDSSKKKLSLVLAKNLTIENFLFKGSYLSTISTLKEDQEFGTLMIENQETISMDASKVSLLLKKEEKLQSYEELPTKQYLIKLYKSQKSERKKEIFELYKRLFFTLIPFTFVFLGLSFGLSIGRNAYQFRLKSMVALVLFVFICYFLAKSCHRSPWLSLIFFTIPHPIVLLTCLKLQRNIEKGIE